MLLFHVADMINIGCAKAVSKALQSVDPAAALKPTLPFARYASRASDEPALRAEGDFQARRSGATTYP